MKQDGFFVPGRLLKLVRGTAPDFAAVPAKAETGAVAAQAPQGLKIVIAGRGKSGTTALYYALKQSLPRNYVHKFEPVRYVPKRAGEGALVKVLISQVQRVEDFDCFDKRIFLIRDPRDIVVSGLLYRIYHVREPLDRQKLEDYLSGLEQKRRDPGSISLLDLQSRLSLLFDRTGRGPGNSSLPNGALWTRQPNHFVYKYEDLIARRFDELEQYLGFAITFSGEVDAKHQRVVRTKAAGGWRDWFTPADVEHYRPLFQDFLIQYGYAVDWTLNPNPQIAAEHSTLYVQKVLAEGLAARRKASPGLRARFKAWRRSLSKS